MRPANVYFYGTDKPLPQSIPLQAGAFTLVYQAGSLRYIRLGNQETVRMIYSAVRDHNWLTVPDQVQNEEIVVHSDSFRIKYDCLYEQDSIGFRARYVFEGTADSRITCRMEGEAVRTFRKNRIGFCIHHPIKEMLGVSCVITHPDGTTASARFPEAISPHQPFKDLREMSWPVADGCRARLLFEGDVFETEDQRNWTDGSYKTYCTPLENPFPVIIEAGEKINQQVVLQLEGNYSPKAMTTAALVFSSIPGPAKPFPAVGVGHATGGEVLGEREVAHLQALHLHHYRVDIPLHDAQWQTTFIQAATEARKLSLPLEAALFFGGRPQTEALAFSAVCQSQQIPLQSVIILHQQHKITPIALLQQVVPLLREQLGKQVHIGAGTDAYFAELNRNRIHHPDLDFLSFSVNPQVHAADAQSLVENLEAQTYTVATARTFANGKRIFVTPITLKRRYNPDATGEQPATKPGELPWNVDPRQPSLFAAAWTLGSLKYLAESGADSLTYYETLGMRGLLQGSTPPALRDQFKAEVGTVFPVYFVLQAILGFQPAKILPSRSSQPLVLDGLVLQKENGQRKMLLANFTAEPQSVSVAIEGEWSRYKQLHADSYPLFAHQPGLFMAPDAWQILTEKEIKRIAVPPLATIIVES